MSNNLQKILDFVIEAEKLKRIERFKGQCYWKDYPKLKRYESVADHSWRVALLILLFESELPKNFDIEKALKMAIIHDLPEIIAGDASPMGKDGTGKNTHAFNENRRKERRSLEKESAKKLFSTLPKKEYEKLYKLWLEYEKQDCIEAKVVKTLDRIECMLQVYQYRNGHLFKKHKDFTIKYGQEFSKIHPSLKRFGDLIADKINKNYKGFKTNDRFKRKSWTQSTCGIAKEAWKGIDTTKYLEKLRNEWERK